MITIGILKQTLFGTIQLSSKKYTHKQKKGKQCQNYKGKNTTNKNKIEETLGMTKIIVHSPKKQTYVDLGILEETN